MAAFDFFMNSLLADLADSYRSSPDRPALRRQGMCFFWMSEGLELTQILVIQALNLACQVVEGLGSEKTHPLV
jgi:hypothetical protein